MNHYTQFVLTVIAVSLAIIAWGQLSPRDATAQGAACGTSGYNPCFVTTNAVDVVRVHVVNSP